MALSNRDRIGRMFEVLAPALDDYISSVIGQADPALGADWTKLVQAKDVKNGASPTKAYEPLDPQVQFRILTEGNITGAVKELFSRYRHSTAPDLAGAPARLC